MSPDRNQFRVQLEADGAGPSEQPEAQELLSSSTPFCIAVVGDLSGRANRGLIEVGRSLATRRPVLVDRDTVDQVMARLESRIRMPGGSGELNLRFAELEDFHPDRLFQRLGRFDALREARDRAAAPAPARERRQESSRVQSASRGPSGGLLDQILGDAPAPPGGAAALPPPGEPAPALASDSIAEFARRVVSPHVVADSAPARPDLVAQVDASIAAEMRDLLHDPDFKALEAAWRSVDFLVRRLETDESLRIYLIDLSKAELEADLGNPGSLADSGTYRMLVESSVGTAGGTPWALLIGLFEFSEQGADAALLRRLAAIARAAGAPWIGGASPSVFGCPSFGEAPDPDDWRDVDTSEWDAFRRTDDARYVALAAPRFLLRLPYGGPDGDPSEVVGFEELSAPRSHEEYLWGHSSVLCGLVVGEAFAADGWALRPRLDVTGLPLHLVRDGGEVSATPCAEAVLSARAVDRIVDRGVMAVQSLKDGDAVRFARLQSIADPLAAIPIR